MYEGDSSEWKRNTIDLAIRVPGRARCIVYLSIPLLALLRWRLSSLYFMCGKGLIGVCVCMFGYIRRERERERERFRERERERERERKREIVLSVFHLLSLSFFLSLSLSL